ncbi:hypothetical protein TRICI_000621 [Trichomonascus ciferrii]|uniref:Uncharacterized protein n=1 Tax=Trichomonascus ciferrii TaxID=44093 RepID=A0A642VBG8_9ASCO|nr:hypothetical protein TRICI_000621 [Trichomonascus ciferrii]
MGENNAQVFDLLKQLSQTTGESSEAPQQQPASSGKPDPTRITDYSSALKYIVKYVTSNDYIMDEIRVLVQTQNRKEEEWAKGRQEVIRKQQVRSEGQAELADVLKLVGASQPSTQSSKASENDRELASYDRKIYQSALNLQQSQLQTLAELKIPLFCINSQIPKPQNLDNDRRKVLELLKDLI